MIGRLRRKFILVNMSIVTVLLLAVFALVFTSTVVDLRRQSERDTAILMEGNLEKPGAPGGPNSRVPIPYIRIMLDKSGNILSAKSDYYDLTQAESLTQMASQALSQEQKNGYLPQFRMRYRKAASPRGTVLVFVDVSGKVDTLAGLLKSCLGIGCLAFGAFFLLSVLLARWAVRPVEEAWNQQRQFVADASHELKTPLTVVMTNAELLISPDYPREQKEQFARSILTMSYQMRGLVENLLELARVDAGKALPSMEALDLSSLTTETLLPFEPVFFEGGLVLESRIQEGVSVMGNGPALKQVLNILLDNAQKYSTPGGTVILSLTGHGRQALLSVDSPGQEISKKDLKNIFRRFYRLDQARAMDHSYGLGLSIASALVARHKGKIWAESKNGRNTFHVQLNQP